MNDSISKRRRSIPRTALLLLIALGLVCVSPIASQTPASTQAPADTTVRGPVLELDFPSLHIGIAEYPDGPTGTTVFYFPTKAKIAVDARGGAPGTMMTDYLRLGYDAKVMDAVVFSGGSSYGLSAGTGVAEGIKEMRSDGGDWEGIAGVVGAIIFDLGTRRDNTITPDAALGKAALGSAQSGRFPLGAQGAGRLAKQGAYFARKRVWDEWPASGQGGAFRQIGPTKIAFFTVVNALGTVVDRNGRVVRCGHAATESGCGAIQDHLTRAISAMGAAAEPEPGPTENTTISLLVTNQRMPFAALERLAVQVHTSMGRAIQPFATNRDGDVLYAATTDEVDNEHLDVTDLAVIASEVAWDAVLASVPER